MADRAFVTLITSDSYVPGALALAHSIRRSGSLIPLIVLATKSHLGDTSLFALKEAFNSVIDVGMLHSNNQENLELLGRIELDVTYTKLHCWNPRLLYANQSLICRPYSQIAFLDADTIVLENIDDIFEYLGDAVFAASPDIGWPDCFNSGVFVCKPDQNTFDRLLQFSKDVGSFDGGDQGLLNSFFSTWSTGSCRDSIPASARLPFTYNVTPSATYSYLPAYLEHYSSIRVLHFIGAVKPWMINRYSDGFIIPPDEMPIQIQQMIQKWWWFYEGYFKSKRDALESRSNQSNSPHELYDTRRSQEAIAGRELPVGTTSGTRRARPRAASPIKEALRHNPRKQHRSVSPSKRYLKTPAHLANFKGPVVYTTGSMNHLDVLQTTQLVHHTSPHLMYDNAFSDQDSQTSFDGSQNERGDMSIYTNFYNEDISFDSNDFGNYRVDWNEREIRGPNFDTNLLELKKNSPDDEEVELDDRNYLLDDESPKDETAEMKRIRKAGIRNLRLRTDGSISPSRGTDDDDILSASDSSGNSIFNANQIFGVSGTNFLGFERDAPISPNRNLTILNVQVDDWIGSEIFEKKSSLKISTKFDFLPSTSKEQNPLGLYSTIDEHETAKAAEGSYIEMSALSPDLYTSSFIPDPTTVKILNRSRSSNSFYLLDAAASSQILLHEEKPRLMFAEKEVKFYVSDASPIREQSGQHEENSKIGSSGGGQETTEIPQARSLGGERLETRASPLTFVPVLGDVNSSSHDTFGAVHTNHDGLE